MMYSLVDYGHMIADRVRMDSYAHALRTMVTSDSIVLDIGAATGIHSLLACKFGARHVYAVEPNDAIHLARKLAQINGFSDRIDYIQDSSANVTLPEKVDLIVSDLRGVLPLFGLHIPTIIDARERHMAPGGVLIPWRDTLWTALVEVPYLYKELIEPWDFPYGLSMAPAKELALNNWTDFDSQTTQSRNLLTEPQRWAELDYTSIADSDLSGPELIQDTTRSGTAHGWLVWFDSELCDGIGFSNGPHERSVTTVYGRAFFPLLEPVKVALGDSVALEIQARLKGDEYIWQWQTHFLVSDNGNRIKKDFNQSTADSQLSAIFSRDSDIAHLRPTSTEAGELDRFILSLLDGNHPIEQIAQQAITSFPSRFDDLADALRYVYDLSREYAI
jgi:protein arginine N-methyltransferase 1